MHVWSIAMTQAAVVSLIGVAFQTRVLIVQKALTHETTNLSEG
jgi:hypothetical protein